MGRRGHRFSEELKRQAIQGVLFGESQASVARRYSVSVNSLFDWLKSYRAGRLGGEATGDPSVATLLLDQQIKGEIIEEQTQEIHL